MGDDVGERDVLALAGSAVLDLDGGVRLVGDAASTMAMVGMPISSASLNFTPGDGP